MFYQMNIFLYHRRLCWAVFLVGFFCFLLKKKRNSCKNCNAIYSYIVILVCPQFNSSIFCCCCCCFRFPFFIVLCVSSGIFIRLSTKWSQLWKFGGHYSHLLCVCMFVCVYFIPVFSLTKNELRYSYIFEHFFSPVSRFEFRQILFKNQKRKTVVNVNFLPNALNTSVLFRDNSYPCSSFLRYVLSTTITSS